MAHRVQILVVIWFLFLFLYGPEAAQGAEQTTGEVTQTSAPVGMKSADDMLTSWLRMFGALITVLGIFFMGVFLFRKYGNVLQNKAAQGHLKVLEYRALNQKNSMYVLDYQGERFLVATCQQGSPVLTSLKYHAPENDYSNPNANDDFKDEIRKAMNENT